MLERVEWEYYIDRVGEIGTSPRIFTGFTNETADLIASLVDRADDRESECPRPDGSARRVYVRRRGDLAWSGFSVMARDVRSYVSSAIYPDDVEADDGIR